MNTLGALCEFLSIFQYSHRGQNVRRFLGDRLDELCRFHLQCVCQLHDVYQTDIALTPLDPAYIVTVKIRQLGQTLLRQTALNPQLSYTLAEEYARVRSSHF